MVLVDVVKSIRNANEFFVLLELVYVFMSTSKAHVIFMEQKTKKYPDKQPLRLQRLSDTRWTFQYSLANVISCRYDCILASLEEISCGSDAAKAIEARGIYEQIKTFSFLISLIIFDKILRCTKCLCDQLQSVSIDLASAAELVLACKATLQQYRSDEIWDKVFKYAGEVANLYDIENTVYFSFKKKMAT